MNSFRCHCPARRLLRPLLRRSEPVLLLKHHHGSPKTRLWMISRSQQCRSVSRCVFEKLASTFLIYRSLVRSHRPQPHFKICIVGYPHKDPSWRKFLFSVCCNAVHQTHATIALIDSCTRREGRGRSSSFGSEVTPLREDIDLKP